MALISCSECGKEVSDKAAACPNCGAPIDVSIARSQPALGPATVKVQSGNSDGARVGGEKTASNKWPWQIYLLLALVIFFCIREYLGISMVYGNLRVSGIEHEDVENFSKFPLQASVYRFQQFLFFVAIIDFLTLIGWRRVFPFVFSVYYMCLVAFSLAGFIFLGEDSAKAVGVITMQSILCVPWLVYIFKSPRARGVFGLGNSRPLTIMKTCPKCGRTTRDTSSYCECGHKFGSGA